jgi:hypothetical protein
MLHDVVGDAKAELEKGEGRERSDGLAAELGKAADVVDAALGTVG